MILIYENDKMLWNVLWLLICKFEVINKLINSACKQHIFKCFILIEPLVLLWHVLNHNIKVLT